MRCRYLEGVKRATVRNVTTFGAYRNGLSVIDASDLLVENCSFLSTGNTGRLNGGDALTPKTGGTAPRGGVDLEPDNGQQRLVGITLRNVLCADNVGDAFDVPAPYNDSIMQFCTI